MRRELGGGGRHALGQRTGAIDRKHHAQLRGRASNSDSFRSQGRRIDECRARGVVRQKPIFGGLEKRAGCDRNDSGFDGAPEHIEKNRFVERRHDQTLAGCDPETEQRIAGTADILRQLRIAHLAALMTQRNPLSAALIEVSVDERDGDVEVCGEVKRVRHDALINSNRVVPLGNPDHARFLIAR